MKQLYKLSWLLLALVIQNCNITPTKTSKSDLTMYKKFNIALEIKWGNKPDEVHPNIHSYPAYSLTDPKLERKKYAPVQFRLSKNGFHILNKTQKSNGPITGNGYSIIHFSFEGHFVALTEIAPASAEIKNWSMIDFMVDSDLNCILLEDYSNQNGRFAQVRKIEKSGSLTWVLFENNLNDSIDMLTYALNGKLLPGINSNFYISSTNQPNFIVSINNNIGKVEKVVNLRKGAEKTFFKNETGKFLTIHHQSNENKRGIVVFNPQKEEESYYPVDDNLYGKISTPFGLDNEMNFYTYLNYNLNAQPSIYKFSMKGKILKQEPLKDIVVRGQTVYKMYTEGRLFFISSYPKNGTPAELTIPVPEKFSSSIISVHLIKVGDDGYYFLSDDLATILICDDRGKVVREILPPLNALQMESSTQNFLTWQVGSDGCLYIPITSKDGFKIIKMSLNE